MSEESTRIRNIIILVIILAVAAFFILRHLGIIPKFRWQDIMKAFMGGVSAVFLAIRRFFFGDDDELEEEKAYQSKLEEQVQGYRESINKIDECIKSLDKQIAKREAKIEALTEQLNEIRSGYKDKLRRYEELSLQVASGKARREDIIKEMKNMENLFDF